MSSMHFSIWQIIEINFSAISVFFVPSSTQYVAHDADIRMDCKPSVKDVKKTLKTKKPLKF